MPISRKDFISDNEMPTTQGRETFLSLAKQCKAEYDAAWKNQKAKKDESMIRLKLYNNQKRDKSKVGDVTLFTTFQTVLASLYVDQLTVEFNAREEGDEEVADNLNVMSEYDYSAMGKDELDYNWMWDTCFFGRGYVDLSEFERDADNNIFVPLPKVIDPIPLLRDPYASSVNGDRGGRGAARFFGYETRMTQNQIEKHPHMFDDIDYKGIEFGSGNQSLSQDAAEARANAQGRQGTLRHEEENLGDNSQYTITEWFTHTKLKGEIKKCKVWLANDRSKVIGVQEMDHDWWPVIDRSLYPTAHDWDGVSIPDIVEDKQRARAMISNLLLEAGKADAYPMYVFDKDKITNRKNLSFEFNKFIPVDNKDGGNVLDAIAPLRKSSPNLPLLNSIYTSLDVSSQKATSTPEIQQGMVSSQQRTLGELNMVASNVQTRYSLSAAVFGWSEKRFWRQWYQLYKDNFADDIDEKIVRLVGAFGAKWRTLEKSNIIAKIDPDVKIESKVVSRAKELEERQLMMGYFQFAFEEPSANRRYGLRKLGRLNGMSKDELDRLLPETIDEREAEQENDALNNNKFVPVTVEQDHVVHLEILSKANDTDAAKIHKRMHEEALMIKRVKPELFPSVQDMESTDMNPLGSNSMGSSGGPQQPGIASSQASGQQIMQGLNV